MAAAAVLMCLRVVAVSGNGFWRWLVLWRPASHPSSRMQCSKENQRLTASPSATRLVGEHRTIICPNGPSITYCTKSPWNMRRRRWNLIGDPAVAGGLPDLDVGRAHRDLGFVASHRVRRCGVQHVSSLGHEFERTGG